MPCSGQMRALLWLATLTTVGASSASGSDFIPDFNFVTGHKTVAYSEPSNMTTYNCRKMDMDLFDNLELSKLCAEACPKPELINFHEGCATGHTFHSVHYLFNEARSLLFGRQYIIFSISFYLIIGAICRMSFPKNVPYTVGLLMLSFIVAVVGHTTQMDPGCPMYAFRLAGGDGVVQREEWDAFVCAGCHPNSYCVQKGGTCGDGSAEAPNCAWTFEDLNKPIKAMPMGWEEEYDSHAKDVLTADQLWTPQCNLYKDMLMPLAEIDPHVLLVVFLPALLFESAFFGIEVRKRDVHAPPPPLPRASLLSRS